MGRDFDVVFYESKLNHNPLGLREKVSEKILAKLVQAAKTGRLYHFTQFEVEVAKASSERHAHPNYDWRYLGIFDEIIDEVNGFLLEIKNPKAEGLINLVEDDEDILAQLCHQGIHDYIDHLDESSGQPLSLTYPENHLRI